MRSLRAQLLLGIVLGTSLVLLVSAAVLYALLDRVLRAEFDHALLTKARALAALTEQSGTEIEFELSEAPSHAFDDHYQLRHPDGAVLAHSPGLAQHALPEVIADEERPAFLYGPLPDGQPGRFVAVAFAPRQDADEGRSAAPLLVTLVVARPLANLQHALGQVRITLLGVCIATVALSSFVLIWVVRRSLRPVDELSRKIADLDADHLQQNVTVAGATSELAPVIERLNELLARLAAAFERERRFTGDVAHELRTPLAGVRSKLELALSRERPPDDYRKTLDDCRQINGHMQRMVEKLLHLARADAGQLDARPESVDVSSLAGRCWEPLRERAAERNLHVDWRLNGPVVVQTDRDQLMLALHNVLENAAAYTNESGEITVSLVPKPDAVELEVRNTGNKVAPEVVHSVFDRFWRGASTSSGSGEHCGLGLPLTKAVIERLGGSIRASASPDGTFAVSIRLPRGE